VERRLRKRHATLTVGIESRTMDTDDIGPSRSRRIKLRLLRWRIKLRYFLPRSEPDQQFAWHKKPLSVFVLYILCWFLWHWEFHIPSPGKCIAMLAVAAVVMSLRVEIEWKEKLAWILLVFGFLSLELTSIDTDRTINDAIRTAGRAQEAKDFSVIGERIEKSVQTGQRQFRATMDEFTGAGSYIVVTPIYNLDEGTLKHPPHEERTFSLRIRTGRDSRGTSDFDTRVYLLRGPWPPPGRGSMAGFIPPESLVFDGTVDKGYSQVAWNRLVTYDVDKPPITYTVKVFDRNGDTVETLDLRPTGTGTYPWEYSYEITRQGKVLERSNPNWQQLSQLRDFAK
jgi:hypothetical protein